MWTSFFGWQKALFQENCSLELRAQLFTSPSVLPTMRLSLKLALSISQNWRPSELRLISRDPPAFRAATWYNQDNDFHLARGASQGWLQSQRVLWCSYRGFRVAHGSQPSRNLFQILSLCSLPSFSMLSLKWVQAFWRRLLRFIDYEFLER